MSTLQLTVMPMFLQPDVVDSNIKCLNEMFHVHSKKTHNDDSVWEQKPKYQFNRD